MSWRTPVTTTKDGFLPLRADALVPLEGSVSSDRLSAALALRREATYARKPLCSSPAGRVPSAALAARAE